MILGSLWFSRLKFPNGMSCSMYVSRILHQFHVHGRAPRRTGVYDQMEQLFTNGKFHFCSRRNFRVFFLNGKRPVLASCSQGESWLYSGRAFQETLFVFSWSRPWKEFQTGLLIWKQLKWFSVQVAGDPLSSFFLSMYVVPARPKQMKYYSYKRFLFSHLKVAQIHSGKTL